MQRLRRLPTAQLELLACATALLVALAVELVVAWFIHTKGVGVTGDEPSYIIQAQAYLHFRPNILSTVKSDLAAHSLAAYPVGTPISAVESFIGPHGMISPFEPGLGVLLIPFVATGRLVLGPTVGMLVLNTVGLIYLHRRVSRLARLSGSGQVLLGLALAGPALLLAMTQIYPDLLSGVLLACAIVEVACLELTRTSGRLSAVIVAISMAFLPWLQIKNLLPALVVLCAFIVVRSRARSSWKSTAITSGVCLLSWGTLLAYNLRYFGHLLGLPEPAAGFNRVGLEYTLGLLFDRDQGLFVQVPIIVVGLVGLWMARKRLPISVIVTILSVGSILVLNGTYTSTPYGGYSLAGRFMWTAIPVLVAWIGVVLAGYEKARRPMRWPILAVGALWVYQGTAILVGSHSYYNAYSKIPPWDPASWPGWWPGINRVLPQFDLAGHPLGAPAIALVVALALAAIVGIAASQYVRAGNFSQLSAAAIGVLAVFIVVALVTIKPLMPATTLSYGPTELGTPVVGRAHPATSPVTDLQGVIPGTYSLSLTYHLQGQAASGSMIVMCSSSPGARGDSVTLQLHPGRRTASGVIRCHDAGVLAAEFKVGARSELSITELQLQSVITAATEINGQPLNS
jgi:hypothetical protein